MTVEELERICHKGEGQHIEFKQYISEPDQIIEEVSGFLNSLGGLLLIGVKDNGSITGLKYPEDDLVFILDYIKKKITPKVLFHHEIITINRKRGVILLEFKAGAKKPYGIIDEESGIKKIFYRTKDQCIKTSRELKNILRSSKKKDGQTIIYSDLEGEILKIVDRNGKVSKKELRQVLDYTSRQISDCLVRLVVAGILNINPSVDGDLYDFNQIS
jgi:predicted HTH transcriptional regulator